MTGPLLVASPGGHLDELLILVDQLGLPRDEAVWVSAPTSQTRSLLAGEKVVWLPRIGSGERRKALQALPAAIRLHRQLRPSMLVSTGALFVVPHLLAAAGHRCETWFVDSATRVDAPSQTGRLAQRLPGVKLFAQGDGWGDRRWQPVPSVLDAFQSARRPAGPALGAGSTRATKVVVSLGTELWPFPRAVAGALRVLPAADVVWQTGSTVFDHDGRRLQQWLPAEELHAALGAADVVITHGGVGSVLACLRQGTVPVVLPRTAGQGEHIDDHQHQFARLLAERDLAVCTDPDRLSEEHLARAAAMWVRPGPSAADLASDPSAHPLHDTDDPAG